MSKQTVRRICYDNVDMEGALSLAKDLLQAQGVSTVVTPNAEIAQMCLENACLAQVINDSNIVLPDGSGVVLAAKILGTPLRGKVAGVEFGEKLLSIAAQEGLGVYLLGGKPGVAQNAAEKLKIQFPDLDIRGVHDGYFDKSGAENEAIVEAVNTSEAQILFVCFGAPLQETWIYANKNKLTHVRLAACLGGSLDIYAGTAKRAPPFFIKAHLEWLYRLLKEPKRIGRMMRLPKYIAGACAERLKRKKQTEKQ